MSQKKKLNTNFLAELERKNAVKEIECTEK